ncbi:MAG: ABC transporter ATP-binding protein [Polyangiaceae bacterium]
MIEIRELTKYYGDAKAVGPLSFSIEKGQVVGLLGLNGAGKTTTLRMLASDLLPTSGTMTVDNVDLVQEPERLRPKIGYLPDRPPLYEEMGVREYLRFAAKLRGVASSRLDKFVAEAIEQTDLGDRSSEIIGTLSHGFRQRVGIAQAIVHKPNLLLLDEPISGLDPVQIVEMRELVRSLRGEHTTVLSSHILSEISETCDQLIVIRDGEIVAAGSESELTERGSAGTQAVVVLIAGGAEADPSTRLADATSVLEGIDGVRGGAAIDHPDLDEGTISLKVTADVEVRHAVCRALVAADIDVYGIERPRVLEDVFIELTSKGEVSS